MPITREGTLPTCSIESNCILVELKSENIDQDFNKLVEAASQIPRTTILENTDNYWHGLCRSLIFRFPDDLELLKLNQKRIIQVRSASRIGIGDLGVNRGRVNRLCKELLE